MAYYGESLNSFKPSHSFLEIDQSFDVVNQFSEFSGNVIDSSNLGFISCTNENFNLPLLDNFFGFWPLECLKPAMGHTMVACVEKQRDGGNKRKAESVSVTHYGSSSMTPSETERKNGLGSVKRMKGSLKEVDKGKEVVHVRARRGQATDSHSLAERVRRKKINEKMKFLQDIVPGCYKTMGMAGVLDEIINYVQFLQNQVEFLSMKLSAATSFCDFILETTTTWQNKKYFQGWVMPSRPERWRD